MNINLYPLFLNKSNALLYECGLVCYVCLICACCFLCFSFIRILGNDGDPDDINSINNNSVGRGRGSEVIDLYIRYAITSIALILVTYFLCITILDNKTVVFKIFNKDLIENKLGCCFNMNGNNMNNNGINNRNSAGRVCDSNCLDVLKIIYRGFILRMFNLQLGVFVLVSVNLAVSTLLLIKVQNDVNIDGLDSLRSRYGDQTTQAGPKSASADMEGDNEMKGGGSLFGGFHSKKPKKK